jgi:hypothetical protein
MPMHKIKDIEKEHGDLNNVIPELVNTHGQYKAGEILGTCASTISRWLKENNYRKVIVYIRDEDKAV